MAQQRILPVRREYNRWVANETLEDYALRFTARSARRYSTQRIAQTAIGAISFLALEAIGGAITLSYGTHNAIAAILVAGIAILLVGAPIARYAREHGVDIDLLTRGASFGYIGSTVTSLIYASFTFILFAIEASIMSSALELAFGLPMWIGYMVSAVAVIPLVTHGVKLISRFQIVTQPIWIVLNVLPFVWIALIDWSKFSLWTSFQGLDAGFSSNSSLSFSLLKVGAASAVILALMTQIGEQVDFLRFLPERKPGQPFKHRLAVFLAGSGWIVLGVPKLLAGSFLAVLVLAAGAPATLAADPGHMYVVAFGYFVPNQTAALLLMAAFVVISQLKINVMNAYAGSLAWSNFFSRLTHGHPGRVVWLLFNVVIALMLMEIGIYRVLEITLAIFSILAMSWLSAISADLTVNKRLGLAPPGIEFKRAHLYDINPVGLGSMLGAAAIALSAHFGAFGELAAAFAPYIAMIVAFTLSPLIAWGTKGRYYLARRSALAEHQCAGADCAICEHGFEDDDMAWCPAYDAPICSLCCTLDARCGDLCKPKASARAQIGALAATVLPGRVLDALSTRVGRYGLSMSASSALIAGLLALIFYFTTRLDTGMSDVVGAVLLVVFLVFVVVAGILVWFLILAEDSRHVAEEESSRQTTLLLKEIEAHKKTDAALQQAKETAEAANQAKSRYVVGLGHELRTPLNAVLGYAQLLERDKTLSCSNGNAVEVIKRSAEHLSGLIDGLLDISRIEAGRLQVYSNEISVHAFLDQIVGMFRLQAEAKGLKFEHSRDAHLPDFVRTDEKRLRQILVNLLSNAIKFTDEGKVCFCVRYRSGVASFVVEDSGPGIAPDEREAIFEPFSRARRHTKNVPGLGLGLTISKLLTETLGGEITVESEPEKGARFSIRLMLSALDRSPTTLANRQITGYSGAKRRLMVVDDNEEHRALMEQMLAPLGFDVVLASSGEEALSIDGLERFDLFLLDILMPGLNGWKVANRLRARGIKTPLLMVSANIGDALIREPGEQPHNDSVSKPVVLLQLLDKLQVHLGLVWQFESGGDFSPPPARQTAGPDGPQSGASASELERLRGLAKLGNVRAIDQTLTEWRARDGASDWLDELRACARDYDYAQMARLLETPRNE